MRAYVFPGQGAQYPGMARDYYEQVPQARSLMDMADEILGFKLTEVMFAGTAEELKSTAVTQPAVFLHSYVAYLCSGLPAPDMTAGHSLGEFTALAAAGALSFEDALRLVSLRAKAMQKACDSVPGTMAAIVGLPADKVEAICASVDGVVAANYNNDSQIVISGTKDAVVRACVLMKEAGARRALELQVGGAFHSPLMESARAELAEAIASVPFHTPVCPVYQNFTAKASTDFSVIRENLLRQLTGPVLWTQSVRAMLGAGAVEFVEFGPGSVLQGLIAKIANGIPGLSLSGISSLA